MKIYGRETFSCQKNYTNLSGKLHVSTVTVLDKVEESEDTEVSEGTEVNENTKFNDSNEVVNEEASEQSLFYMFHVNHS